MTVRGRLLSGLVATVIALAGFVTVGAPTAAARSIGTLQYVALGDSYAAGIGAPPYVSSSGGCLQSNDGYPALLDRRGRIDLQVNATCPGFTTTDVANLVASPLNPLTPGVELVTLTVGGNDLGFADLAGTCTTPGQEAQCLIAITNAVTDEQLTDLYEDLTLLYGQVAKAAPNALIVVTGYPYLFESDPENPNPIVTAFNAATTALNQTIAAAVKDAHDDNGVNIIYVDVTEQFEGHGIGSSNPFINGPTAGFPEAFHPNPAGYRAYAKAISAAIRDALDRQKQLA